MTQAAQESVELPYARRNNAKRTVNEGAIPLLRPITQSDAVEVGSIAGLRNEALRMELVAWAAALVPLQQKNAQKTHNDRRVVDENIAAIEAARLFKITAPRRFGGLETDVRTALR